MASELTELEISEAIIDRFVTVAEGISTAPIFTPNVVEIPPSDGSTWMRLSIAFGSALAATFGGGENTDRRVGIAFLQIFIPLNQGTEEGRLIARYVAIAIKRTTVDGVRYRVPTVRDVGPTKGYFQINVECPFWADDIR